MNTVNWEKSFKSRDSFWMSVTHLRGYAGRTKCGCRIPNDERELRAQIHSTGVGKCIRCFGSRGVYSSGISTTRGSLRKKSLWQQYHRLKKRITHASIAEAIAEFKARGGLIKKFAPEPNGLRSATGVESPYENFDIMVSFSNDGPAL